MRWNGGLEITDGKYGYGMREMEMKVGDGMWESGWVVCCASLRCEVMQHGWDRMEWDGMGWDGIKPRSLAAAKL